MKSCMCYINKRYIENDDYNSLTHILFEYYIKPYFEI